MPQPLRYKPKDVLISADALLHRPQLAAHIGAIAACWNRIEHWKAAMFTYLLLGKEEAAFEIYYAFHDTHRRDKAFLSVAKTRLSAQLLKETENLIDKIKKTSPTRNEIVHGIWAVSPTKPESLLLCTMKDLNIKIGDICKKLHRYATGMATPENIKPEEFIPDSFMEYKLRDFEDIRKRLILLDEEVLTFSSKILTHCLLEKT